MSSDGEWNQRSRLPQCRLPPVPDLLHSFGPNADERVRRPASGMPVRSCNDRFSQLIKIVLCQFSAGQRQNHRVLPVHMPAQGHEEPAQHVAQHLRVSGLSHLRKPFQFL